MHLDGCSVDDLGERLVMWRHHLLRASSVTLRGSVVDGRCWLSCRLPFAGVGSVNEDDGAPTQAVSKTRRAQWVMWMLTYG